MNNGIGSPRDDFMEVTSPLGSQPFDEPEEHEDSIHESIEVNPEYESMETAPVTYAPGLLPGATIPKAIKPAEVPLQGTPHVQFQPLLPAPGYSPSQYAQQQYLWQQQSQSSPYLPLQQAPTFPEITGIQSPKPRGSLSRVLGSMLGSSSSSSSRGKKAVHRTPTPAPESAKKVAQAYKETPEMAAFRKTANETAQKLKEATEQTSDEARKALTDIANLTTTYHQQREADQATTTHNLEALKDELLGHMQQQYNDFDDRLKQQWAALDAKFTAALKQQRKDLVTEFANHINPLVVEFNTMANTLGAW
ncbi:hypothetical protein BDZ91DRAFT_821191 [Kalaharituber pfeilii]|nr:hypothetical protein BDZ91DRAFT_821191 [Kalaharituber pfeilii]